MLCSSMQGRVGGWHRNALLQLGSSRNVFIYIKTLLYRLKLKEKKKRKRHLRGVAVPKMALPTFCPVSLLPSFCSGLTVSATISVGSQLSLSVNTYVCCLNGFKNSLFSASKENSCPHILFLIYLCNTV